jgi:hypothetical protein
MKGLGHAAGTTRHVQAEIKRTEERITEKTRNFVDEVRALTVCSVLCCSTCCAALQEIGKLTAQIMKLTREHAQFVPRDELNSRFDDLDAKMFRMAQLCVAAQDALRCNSQLEHSSTCCNSAQHVATEYSTLQHSAKYCNAAKRAATQRNALRRSTCRCNTAHSVATDCSRLQRGDAR